MPAALSDGTEVPPRPIRPEDEPLEREMLTSLSEKTLRQRFFTVVKDITHEMLIRFCNIDYEREMAIVVEIKEAGEAKGSSASAGSSSTPVSKAVNLRCWYTMISRARACQFLDMMIGIAQEKGLEEIYGIVLYG